MSTKTHHNKNGTQENKVQALQPAGKVTNSDQCDSKHSTSEGTKTHKGKAGRGKQFDLIERIRTETFLMDSHDAHTDNMKTPDPTSLILGRAVALLADNLYSKDVHFILEIIQNAEDNSYPANVIPTLKFYLSKTDPTNPKNREGALYILNNETGFNEDNVIAISNIATSTKKNKTLGYIGEKGIGFKSVFLITGNPHISSNGYKFSFSEDADPQAGFGYIIPSWDADDKARAIKHASDFTTAMVLPLKPGKRKVVAEQLKKLAPETILFLRTLRAVEIEVESLKLSELSVARRFQVTRTKEKSGISVSLKVNTEEFRFWMVTKSFNVPKSLHCEKRIGVTSSSVSVALTKTSNATSMQGEAFAFLPTEEKTGLPVLMNADFLLNAARESIIVDSPWNIWLRECISEAYYRCVHTYFMEHKKLGYRFIPLSKENDQINFFTPVIKIVQKKLTTSPIIRRRGDHNNRKERWCLPSEAFIAVQEWYGLVDLLYKESNNAVPLVTSRLNNLRDLSVMKAIGVKELSPKQYYEWMEHGSWLKGQILRDKNGSWASKLVSLLSTGAIIPPTDTCTERLSKLYLLPCSDGSVEKAEKGVLYCTTGAESLDENLESDFKTRAPLKVLSKAMYDACSTPVRKWLVKTLHLKESSVLQLFISRVHALCGVPVGDYSDGIPSILPMKLDKNDISSYVLLTMNLVDCMGRFSPAEAGRVLKEWPLLLDVEPARGTQLLREVETLARIQLSERTLVTPVGHDSETGWQHLFSRGNRGHLAVLSHHYRAIAQTIRSSKGESAFSKMWANFKWFYTSSLRASQFPLPRSKNWNWVASSTHSSAVRNNIAHDKRKFWAFPKDMPLDTVNYLCELDVQNTKCRMDLLTTLGVSFPTTSATPIPLTKDGMAFATTLIKYLESCVNVHNHFLVNVGSSRFQWKGGRLITIPSIFKCSLMKIAWVPTQDNKLCPPNQVLLDVPTVRAVIGNRPLRILHKDLRISSRLTDFLEFSTQLTHEHIIEQLRTLSLDLVEDTFRDAQVLYDILCTNMKKLSVKVNKDIKRIFQKEHLICYRSNKDSQDICWTQSIKAVWSTRAMSVGTAQNCPVCLQAEYDAKYRTFFVETLGVREDMNARWYAERWLELSKLPPIKSETESDLIFAKMEVLYDYFEIFDWSNTSSGVSTWLNSEKKNLLPFLTSSGELSKTVYIEDDPSIADALKDHKGFKIMWFPGTNTYIDYPHLLAQFQSRILRLSHVTTVAVDIVRMGPHQRLCPETPLVSHTLKCAVAAFLYSYAPEKYADMKEYGVFKAFLSTKEVFVDSINVSYFIEGTEIRTAVMFYWEEEPAPAPVPPQTPDGTKNEAEKKTQSNPAILWRVANVSGYEVYQRAFDFCNAMSHKLSPNENLRDKLMILLSQALYLDDMKTLEYVLSQQNCFLPMLEREYIAQMSDLAEDESQQNRVLQKLNIKDTKPLKRLLDRVLKSPRDQEESDEEHDEDAMARMEARSFLDSLHLQSSSQKRPRASNFSNRSSKRRRITFDAPTSSFVNRGRLSDTTQTEETSYANIGLTAASARNGALSTNTVELTPVMGRDLYGKGYQMLGSMGWKHGESVGKTSKEHALRVPLMPTIKYNRLGLCAVDEISCQNKKYYARSKRGRRRLDLSTNSTFIAQTPEPETPPRPEFRFRYDTNVPLDPLPAGTERGDPQDFVWRGLSKRFRVGDEQSSLGNPTGIMVDGQNTESKTEDEPYVPEPTRKDLLSDPANTFSNLGVRIEEHSDHRMLLRLNSAETRCQTLEQDLKEVQQREIGVTDELQEAKVEKSDLLAKIDELKDAAKKQEETIQELTDSCEAETAKRKEVELRMKALETMKVIKGL